MPTLNRAKDGSHYYIRSWYEGTWQVSDSALSEILKKYPLVAHYKKEKLQSSYLQHLKRQGWLSRTGEGGDYLAPWEYRQGEFFDNLKAFGIPGVRYPELSVTAGRDGKAWELGILMPAIPQLWLQELPEADYRQLAGDQCSFSVDQHRYPASNLFGAPHLVQVTAIETSTYRISTRSNWPSSIDTSAFDCQVERPSSVTVFQPPGTFGARLVNPRLSAGDEIVVLVQTTDGKTKPLRNTLRVLQSKDCIARGSLRGQENWEVYWIRVPNQGTEFWNLLAKHVGLQERRERWNLDLVLPLPISVSETGIFEVRPTETLLIRIEHSQANGKGLGPSGRELVWEQGGIVLKRETSTDNLNPHFLKFTPPTGVPTATLWVYGADSSPASLSFRFTDGSSSGSAAPLSRWLFIDLRIGEEAFKFDGLKDSHACSAIQVPSNIAAGHIRGVIRSGHEAVSVECKGRSEEMFVRTYRDGESVDESFADYIVRMARAGHPIELEFDSGAWGHIDFQITPQLVQKPAGFETARVGDERAVAANHWRANAFSGSPQHWRRDGSGRGRLIGNAKVES